MEVRNRFKRLDLIDRVPDGLWMEVHDIVQETGIKIIPKKKKCKKAKWLSEEALQIAVKREAENKGQKERYTHLDAEFQRITRRAKKAFLSILILLQAKFPLVAFYSHTHLPPPLHTAYWQPVICSSFL